MLRRIGSALKRGLKKAVGATARSVSRGARNVARNMGEEVEQIGEDIRSEKGKAKMKAMIAARTTDSGRAKPGKGQNVKDIKHIGRANVDGYGGTPSNRKMAKNPLKRNFTGLRSYTGKGGNKAARRAGQPVKDTRKEEVSVYDIVLSHLIDEGYADTVKSAEVIMLNMSEEWRDSIVESKS